ncbi:MAG: sulfurtransferase-like selenium metabolism protein YedF [Clostridia bacterium]|nr:sulfurtransferase-like selenium metabolism protein YedF [Clostridia bacterium]
MAVINVNCIGDQCPIPVVKTMNAIKELKEASVVEVHVDNEIAVQNVSKMANSKNLPVTMEKISDTDYRLLIQVENLGAEIGDAEAACAVDKRSDIVVAIASKGMGHGSDELGDKLMKGFIYALSQQEELPSAILFYNGGAYNTCEGSPSVEDLKNMEAQGVEILTCGTCLDYYGLKDKLAVGKVTNMYDIVEHLTKAGKVIKQ